MIALLALKLSSLCLINFNEVSFQCSLFPIKFKFLDIVVKLLAAKNIM